MTRTGLRAPGWRAPGRRGGLGTGACGVRVVTGDGREVKPRN